MKKRFCLALGLALCLAACDSKEEPAAKTAPAAETAKEAPAAKTAKATPTNDLDKLLEGVELTPKGLKTLYTGKSTAEKSQIDMTLLTHESPVVRAYVYNSVTRNYDKGDAELDKLVKQLQGEKDPTVLAAGIKSLMNNLGRSSDLYNLVFAAIKHENVEVRKSVAIVLSNSNNKNVAGVYDEALKMMFNDSDKKVRGTICRSLPDFGNESIIPEIAKIIYSEEEKDVAIIGDCLEGLIRMWYFSPFFDQHSEAAYKETLKYFNKKPRGKNNPPWNGLSRLLKGYENASAEWKEASSYLKPEEIVAAMVDIIKDPGADKITREYAIKVIPNFGTKKDLEKLDAALTDTADRNAQSIKKKIAEAIETMQ
ncbi:MAG: HEAT repeat domain-containing protein [Fibrobacter sp.]|nr:HEAT repeat domain-containing protein [Fibrobacter sp.]